MKIKIKYVSSLLIIMLPVLLFFNGCNKLKNSDGLFSRTKKKSLAAMQKELGHKLGELDFFVKNKTDKPIYVACFYYAKKETTAMYRWYKTKPLKLMPNQASLIDIDTISNEQNKHYVYGYLGVFLDQTEAETSIYELLSEKNKVDIEKLYKIRGKTVIIEKNIYGFKGDVLNFRIKDEPIDKKLSSVPSLDFRVINKTGKNLWLAGFVYEKQSDIQKQWKFKKTKVTRLDNNASTKINIDPIAEQYDRKNTRGFIALFNQKEEAENSTYELTPSANLIKLGKLYKLKGFNVIIRSKKYGLEISNSGEPETSFFEFYLEKAGPHKESKFTDVEPVRINALESEAKRVSE